jgi:TonB-linked SusC/RagA family outer membrane protein
MTRTFLLKQLKRSLKLMFWGGFLTMICFNTLLAQEVTVTGTVTSSDDGSILPGVNVIISGSATGTVTDMDGNYTIAVPDSEASLVFSFVGFRTQEIQVGSQSVIDVALITDVTQLTEIVVTSLGIEREKKAITYAAQEIRTNEITEARPLNILEGLSGKAAGLSVARVGSGLGSETKVILRGNRSIAGSSQPIYIIDGAIMGGDISNLSPDDIETITVLKGANAAALYGSRAQNGAIIVTTKTGKGTKGWNVELNTTYMGSRPILLTNYQQEYGQGSDGIYSPTAVRSWGSRMDGSQVDTWRQDPDAPSSVSYSPNPDNHKDFFETGHNFATNLGVATSTANSSAYFSYTFTDAGGIVPNNNYGSHNLNVRFNTTINKKFIVDAKANYIRETLENILATGESFNNPIRGGFRIPPNVSTADAEVFEYFNDEGLRTQNYWRPNDNGNGNPYWIVNRNNNEMLRERFIGLIMLKYNFTENLSLLARSSLDRTNSRRTDELYNDSYIIADNGNYQIHHRDGYEWNTDFLLNYNNGWGDWDLDLNFGGQLRNNKFTQLDVNGDRGRSQLNVPNLFALSNTTTLTATEDYQKKQIQSLYGFATISWRNAVFLDITGRNDWSSTLPKDNWSYFYPSVGLSVVVNELFNTSPSWLSLLKVRGSYAEVGNDTDPYRTARLANITAGGSGGFLQLSTTIPIENLLPESTTSTEIGLDLGFFQNRLGFEFTWYSTISENQLFAVNVPVGSGASNVFLNGASIENDGFELALFAKIIQSRGGFNWNLDINYGRNKSMVASIAEGFETLNVGGADFMRQFKLVAGEPWGEVYSRGFLREDADGDGSPDADGRVIVQSDGTPAVTAGLDVPVANFNPDWLGGIRNTFTWKGFSLSFLIDIRKGGSVVSLTNAIMYADGLTEETLNGREGNLVFGENIFENETGIDEGGNPNTIATDSETMWSWLGGRNAPVGEAFVKDASNTRLREMVFAYSLPSSTLKNSVFSEVRIGLVGRNLFFFSNSADNLDPEIFVSSSNNADGFESFGPPTVREFGLNLRLGF